MASLTGLTSMQQQYRWHTERVKARNKDWDSRHREQLLAADRRWREKNRVKIRAQAYQAEARRKAKDPEAYMAKQRKLAQAFRERHRTKLRERAKLTRARILSDPIRAAALKRRVARWRERNKDKIRAAKHQQYLRNKHAFQARGAKRRALKKAATVNLLAITDWLKRVRAKPSVVCYYCERRVPTSDMHIDHIVALANGGAHSVDNLCVSCSHCNSSKGAKPVRAWIRIGQQLLEL